MHLDLLHPIFNILETLSLVYGVSQHYTHSTPIVSLSNRLEFLLTSSIPNLQPNLLFTDSDGFDLEVDTYGGEVRGHEVILAKL